MNYDSNFSNIEYFVNRNCGSESLNILLLNCRSCRYKSDLIENLLIELDTKVHLITLTETWLKPGEIFNLYGYTSYHSHRSESERGGGVSIFILDSFASSRLFEIYDDCHNFLIVEIPEINLKVCGIYTPGRNYNTFIETFETLLNKYKKIIFCGDFNINLTDENDVTVSDYNSRLVSNGFMILNSINSEYSTRISNSICTILDHFSTDMLDKTYSLAYYDSDPKLSDHRSLLLSIKIPNLKNESHNAMTIIDYNKIPNEQFLTTLNYVTDFCELVDVCASAIANAKKVVNKTKSTHIIKSYITKKIHKMLKFKAKIFREHKKYPTNLYIFDLYKKYRNQISNLIRFSKKNYYSKEIIENKNNGNKMFKIMNEIVLNKKTVEKTDKIVLCINGQEKRNSLDVAEIMNDYFINISSEITNNLVITNGSYLDTMVHNQCPLFNFQMCNSAEVIDIIDNINKKAAVGLDNISCKFLKIYKNLIGPKVSSLINDIFSTSIFPRNMKTSKVIFIYKSGSRTEMSNYRPISILNSISKVIESVMNVQLKNFLIENNLINSNQFGFMPKSSTTSAIIHYLDYIYSGLDSGKFVSSIFIDVKKAFDTVDHQILIEKLKFYSLSNQAINLIKSYLIDRIQYGSVDGGISQPRTIISGVPQGGILSTLLFIIFINDIFNLFLYGSMQMYADDAVISYKCNTVEELEIQMSADLKSINDWFIKNKMCLNLSKTCITVFSLSDQYIPIKVIINNAKISQIESTTFLGLKIDSNLKWKSHISHIRNKIAPYIFALAKSRHLMTDKCCWTYYYSFIYPYISYMLPIWGQASESDKNVISVLQKKCIKIIRRLPLLYPTIALYDTKVLSLLQMIDFETMILIYKIKNKILKCNIVIRTGVDVHRYPTRNRNNFRVPFCRTVRAKANVFVQGLRLFNELPSSIKNIVQLNRFKNSLKLHIVNSNL